MNQSTMNAPRIIPPTPILFPDELLLTSMPFKSCSLIPHFPLSRLALHEQRQLRKYDPQNDNNYGNNNNIQTVESSDSLMVTMDPARIRPRFILVHVTTQRILVVPFIQDNFSTPNAFSIWMDYNCDTNNINYKSLISVDSHCVELCFDAVSGGSCLLILKSRSLGRTAEFASLISSLRFSGSVGGLHSSIWKTKNLKLKARINFGGEMYYENDSKSLTTVLNGLLINERANHNINVREYLPGYKESEICIRKYLGDIGILQNLIVVMSGNDEGNNYDSFRFAVMEDTNLKKRLGDYYYSFLCCCAVNYAHRNKEDVAQLIHDSDRERHDGLKVGSSLAENAREEVVVDEAVIDEEHLLSEFLQNEGYSAILNNISTGEEEEEEDNTSIPFMKKSTSVGTNGTMNTFYKQNREMYAGSIQSSVFIEEGSDCCYI